MCQTEGFVDCEYTDIPIKPIPALSEWAMIAAVLGLGIVAVFFAVRRRKAHEA